VFLVLEERFWDEYRGRFGEPDLPMDDLGRAIVRVRVEENGTAEEFEIEGGGYRWDYHMPGSGMSRVQLILNELGKYNIKGRIVMERW